MSVHTKGGLPQPIHSRGLTRIKITLPAVSKVLIMHHKRFEKNLNYLGREDDDDKNDDKEESRLAFALENYISNRPVEFNSGLSTVNPWGQKIKNVLNLGPISVNPNVNYQVASFDSCTSRNGDAGICASRAVCSLFGGRSSGTCLLGLTCCVSKYNFKIKSGKMIFTLLHRHNQYL